MQVWPENKNLNMRMPLPYGRQLFALMQQKDQLTVISVPLQSESFFFETNDAAASQRRLSDF